jgi:hypothetical protein
MPYYGMHNKFLYKKVVCWCLFCQRMDLNFFKILYCVHWKIIYILSVHHSIQMKGFLNTLHIFLYLNSVGNFGNSVPFSGVSHLIVLESRDCQVFENVHSQKNSFIVRNISRSESKKPEVTLESCK